MSDHWPPFFGLWLIGTGVSLGIFVSLALVYRVENGLGEPVKRWPLWLSGIVAASFVAYGFVP